MTRLYAYCLCDGGVAARLELDGAVGVGGACARAVEFGRFVAVVGDYADERVRINRADLLAHNRVNGLVLALTTQLPFRFGTLTSSAQLDEYAARNETALRARLARVRGCVEMSVKIIRRQLHEHEAHRANTSASSSDAEALAPSSSDADAAAQLSFPSSRGRGTAYLAAKRRAIMGDERLRTDAEELAARLGGFMSGVARESSERLSPAAALVLRVAYLVERERVAEYQSRLREFGAARLDVRLLASGPWPPYSFAT